MKMTLIPKSPYSNRPEMELEHRGDLIYWNMGPFKDLRAELDLVEHINLYWQTMPIQTLDRMWQLLKEIHLIISGTDHVMRLISQLQGPVAELLSHYDLGKVHTWVCTRAPLVIPYTLPDQYIHSDDRPGSREKTYTKEDYRWLVSLVVVLRVMVPIWGEFIARTGKETDTVFKEMFAAKILDKADIMHSQPLLKLQEYMHANLKLKTDLQSMIVRGLSTEDYPTWLMGKILVRRVCMGDIRGTSQNSHLISYIYKFVEQQSKGASTGSSFSSSADIVQPKAFESNHTDETKASRLEGYKIRQATSVGRIVQFEVALERPMQLLRKLEPSITEETYAVLAQAANVMHVNPIKESQVTLAQWTLEPVISPRALTAVSKPHVIAALIITQAVLWARGHHMLAGLCTATELDSMEEYSINPVPSTTRIPNDLKELLKKYWPYQKQSEGRNKTKPPNTAEAAIDALTIQLGRRDWLLNTPDDMTRVLVGRDGVRRISCPHDTKVLLARLAIDIVERA